MSEIPAEDLMAETSEWVSASLGLFFPRDRWPELTKRMDLAARELGLESREALRAWLRSSAPDRRQVEVLASVLTVGETYFFREPRIFEILEEHVLSPLIRARRGVDQRLRIWSAGCSSGEEPYSIAVSLHKLLPDLKEWNITILATDINPSFLAKAAEGVYGNWSFRGTPGWILDRYFRSVRGDRREILPRIREKIQFSYLNLVEDTYPSLSTNTNAMDVIFCRNVLMYFASERAMRVLDRLRRSLVEGGWLIVGASELSLVPPDGLARVDFSDAILYRKGDGHSTRPEARDAGAEAPFSLFPAWEPVYDPATPVTKAVPPALPAGAVSTASGPGGEGPPLSSLDEAQELYQAGRYPEAAEKLREQKTPEAMGLLSRSLANEGRLAEALLSCERALAGIPGDAGLRYLRATILQEQGRIEEAARSLRQALYLDPTFVLAHFAQGNLALQRGRRREALKHFRNALSGLADYPDGEILPESEGITAGRLAELIQSTPLGNELA